MTARCALGRDGFPKKGRETCTNPPARNSMLCAEHRALHVAAIKANPKPPKPKRYAVRNYSGSEWG